MGEKQARTTENNGEKTDKSKREQRTPKVNIKFDCKTQV